MAKSTRSPRAAPQEAVPARAQFYVCGVRFAQYGEPRPAYDVEVDYVTGQDCERLRFYGVVARVVEVELGRDLEYFLEAHGDDADPISPHERFRPLSRRMLRDFIRYSDEWCREKGPWR